MDILIKKMLEDLNEEPNTSVKKKTTPIIFDPEDEYLELLKIMGGTKISLNPSNPKYVVNPFDIPYFDDTVETPFYTELNISEKDILSNISKTIDNPYRDISKIKKDIKYCKNPLQKKALEKELQGALKCKKINKNKNTKEEILKEKILNEVKICLKEEKEYLSEEEYINIFYEELKVIVSSYNNLEFDETNKVLIFKKD